MSRSSRSSQRAGNVRTKNISFRLVFSTTQQEIYQFLDVPYDIVMEITGIATNNELQGEPTDIDYGIMLIGASYFALPMNIAQEIIRDLQGRIDPSKQRYRIEYGGWTRNLHRASVYDHHDYFDGTSDAWANQLNTGNYNLSYTQNQAAAAVHFQGHG